MGRIDAVNSNGSVIMDIEVFQEVYEFFGLGWIYDPKKRLFIRKLTGFIYKFSSDIV